ncbi:MAG: group 1 glycosyl transferase [uncultured bacterium]|nr:MAG: group 1 glycosyl transferase [uncultured bacterium]
MKIGIDGSRAFIEKRTGIEEYSHKVIMHLRDRLADDEVILYIRHSQAVDFDLPNNWKIKKLRFPRFWTQVRLSLEMLFHPVDLLFVPAHTVPFIHPKKTVVVIHGLEYEFCPQAYSFLARVYMRFVIKNSCKWASKVVCVSENTKKDVMNIYGTAEDKIEVVYEGYSSKTEGIENLNIFGHAPKEDCDVKGPYVLFFGRIEERKNVKGIVEAFDILKKKYGAVQKLVLIGKPGYGYGEIKKRIGASEFREDILELGYVSDEKKWELLKCADVFVFPSFYEGFGLPILEAQNALVPVVTSKVSSIPEVAGDAVLYADPTDHQSLAENIHILISNKTAKDDIVRRGYENVKRFSWAQCAKDIATLLHS